MLLRRQFNLLSLTAALVLTGVLLATLSTMAQVRAETAQIAQAQATVRGVSGFRYLTMETLLYGEARTKRQWRSRFDSFREALDRHTYSESDEVALLAREKANLEVLDRLFQRLDAPLSGRADHRTRAIVSGLFSTTQEMLDDALQLSLLNQRDLDAAQRRAAWVVFLSMLLLGLLIWSMSSTIRRRVLQPVSDLQAVTEAVSNGNMTARTNFSATDELGRLGQSFDHMTSQLDRSVQSMERENAERRAAQEALAQAQDDMQAILDHTPALVVYWDRHLRNRFANRACVDWFGLTPDEMRGRHVSEVKGTRDVAAMQSRLDSVLAGNSALFEDSIVLASGERRDALFSYTPDIRAGRVDGMYGVISDVTQIREAEAGQARALRKLQSVLTAASDFAIIQTDIEGLIELFSPGAERMLGYHAAELVRQCTPAILHLDEEVRARGAILTAQFGRVIEGFDVFVAEARDGASVSYDWTYVRKDGNRLPVNLTVTATRGAGGEIDGYLGIAKDVSAERDIRRVLAAARDQAEQANLAKSQFLANMSHEIRTPINAVTGMLDLLQYTPLSLLQREYANKARSAARSLLGLLNDILDFSQVEANRIELDLAPFEVEALLLDLSTILSSLVDEKDVEVLFSVDPALPNWLGGDVTRLRQVLINLAGNALKFTEHGEIMVSLVLCARDERGSEVEFRVSDTGIGIAADKIERIFEGFTQAEASTVRRFGGTGLGLTISQRLVALMGGALLVDSTPGAGSCFHFRVLFPDPIPAPLSSPPGAAVLPSGLRVLIVDDSASSRKVLSAIITSFGWSAVSVESGQQALAALDEALLLRQRFDVVLLDWSMPQMDGWETALHIRAHPGMPPMLLMVTAHGRGALAQRLESERGLLNGFLSKPVTPSMLRDAIVAAQAGDDIETAPPPAPVTTRRLAGLRVLVVDDNAMNQQVARELLAHEGAEVGVASSGASGLAMAIADGPGFDAILLDIQMPGMDGYDCARAMRATTRLQRTPIIAMTANVLAGERAACLAAGMNAHMGKPIDVHTMVSLLQLHCGERTGSGLRVAAKGGTALAVPAGGVGIALETALNRLGGNRSLYLSLAQSFSGEAAAFLAALGSAMSRTDAGEAAHHLHAFRSIAGSVGATHLHVYCSDLEQNLRKGSAVPEAGQVLPVLESLIRSSIAELEQATARLRASMATDPPVVVAPALVVRPLADLLHELALQLSASNMRALALMSEIDLQHGAAMGEELDPLRSSIARLDFPSAHRVCLQLREKLS